MVVVIELLAMHAVDALVDVDLAFRMNGLHRTFLGATLTRCTAFRPALQPFEHADPAGNGQRRAQRTEIAAVETLNEQAGGQ
ncbi:hypothetical protein D3C80_1229520 [compost metagenome]